MNARPGLLDDDDDDEELRRRRGGASTTTTARSRTRSFDDDDGEDLGRTEATRRRQTRTRPEATSTTTWRLDGEDEDGKENVEEYALASGQVINFGKSALCVGRSVPSSEGSFLASSMGVRLVKCHERYLGLPSFAGRNKRQLFDSVKDRIWNKLKVWQKMMFSIGGKEVLLKEKRTNAILVHTFGEAYGGVVS
ncbi:hypothetical protein Dsin_015199 [Dipteronia sinensis]|uniref:Uncharacterized protein n=1 Tax=Dipteronia sinensis TaxID=43782 RepID=A0AAE0ABK8_9ROSI|nr:hypothetical protein Dsin_015199 [Dipteronia sinensis]